MSAVSFCVCSDMPSQIFSIPSGNTGNALANHAALGLWASAMAAAISAWTTKKNHHLLLFAYFSQPCSCVKGEAVTEGAGGVTKSIPKT